MTREISSVFALTVFYFWCVSAVAGDVIKSGFVDVNVYPYQSKVSNDNTITVNAFLRFANRFSYFSLTNFSDKKGSGRLPDLDTFFTEQNLRWQIAENSPFELTVQSNFRQGSDNDRHRLGIRWTLNKSDFISGFLDKLHLKYSINWHAVQFDHEDEYIWQLEHAFLMKFPYLSDRLYLSGFADHTFNEDLPNSIPNHPIVGEAQLGFRLFDKLHAVAEYRVNEYRRSDVNNIAVGLEYKFVF